MLATYPFIIIAAGLMVKAIMSRLLDSQVLFAEAGGIAEEILYSVKTIVSFANFKYEKDRFNKLITECYEKGISSAIRNGFGQGFLYFVLFGTYALAVWYGGILLISKLEFNPVTLKPIGPGDIITILFATIMGAFSLGMASPNYRAISDACASAQEFFDTIERLPVADHTDAIQKPNRETITGNLKFTDVNFSYPSKAKDLIFGSVNLNFEAGKKTAIVGESGSGKTTFIHLIERLYDVQGGVISLDNLNLYSLDVDYLRSVIGYVAQEPVLFNTTVRENILFGREGQYTEEQILEVSYTI